MQVGVWVNIEVPGLRVSCKMGVDWVTTGNGEQSFESDRRVKTVGHEKFENIMIDLESTVLRYDTPAKGVAARSRTIQRKLYSAVVAT
jgi:hypothetical protein